MTVALISGLILVLCGILIWALVEASKAQVRAQARAQRAEERADAAEIIHSVPPVDKIEDLAERSRRRRLGLDGVSHD